MNNDLVSLVAALIPSPRLHFLMTGYTPLTVESQTSAIRKTSVLDVMRRLLQTKNVMVSADPRLGCYTSILTIIQGEVDPTQVHKALLKVRERREDVRFIPWGPSSIQVALAKKSPYVETAHKVSGMMLANNTCMRELFSRAVDEFETLRKRGAFINQYKSQDGFDMAEFDDAKETVQSLAQEYRMCESADYLSWDGVTPPNGGDSA
jgi:tubulin gamma